MISTLEKIQRLVESDDVRISEHGYDELANDDLSAKEIVEGIRHAILIEDYPDYPKGSSVLVLQKTRTDDPVHVVWGIPRGHDRPAVLVTAYLHDPKRWNSHFTARKL